MNNKPVAWMNIHGQFNKKETWLFPIPLYTHPVKDKPHPKCDEACMYLCQMRELTDEEIMEVATINLGHSMGLLNWMGFARAILRKAQEK
jgi:hypothetical protein